MWSLVNAIGTNNMFFFPRWHSPLMVSSVWGPSQGIGPTWNKKGEIKEKHSLNHSYKEHPHFLRQDDTDQIMDGMETAICVSLLLVVLLTFSIKCLMKTHFPPLHLKGAEPGLA